MMRFIAACFALLAITSQALAEKRVALVVGNSAYEHVAPLANPKNDAEVIAAALGRLDFEVIKGIDLTRTQFVEKIRDFARAVKGADVALLFYAGHGLQVNGRNYLAPVETQLLDETDLEFETVQLQTILTQMEREPRTNLVFLDACRNNPMTRNLAMSMGTRSASVGRGLAPIETGIGTLIAFATQPGNVALDGEGKNSPFTEALAKHIETPGEDIGVLMRRVRQEVITKTSGQQVPWDNSSLTGSVVLKPAPIGQAAAGDAAPALQRQLEELRERLALAEEQLRSSSTELPANTSEQANKPSPGSEASKENSKDAKIASLPGANASIDRNDDAHSTSTTSEAARSFEVAKKIGTDRAWRLFLSRHGSDRSFGPLAEAALETGATSRSLSPGARMEQLLGLSGDLRRSVQEALTQRGQAIGAVDGIFGPATRNAIAEIQRSEGMSDTGYVDLALLERLGVEPGMADGGDFKSSNKAVYYDPRELEILNEDNKVIAAIRCINSESFGKPGVIYGRFRGRFYLAVRPGGSSSSAISIAKKCGGYVTTINSAAENEFIYQLIAADPLFFHASRQPNNGVSKMGPLIGLVQAPGSKEPAGGWSWSNGEKASYRNWFRSEPNNYGGNEEYAGFFNWAKNGNPETMRADKWFDGRSMNVGFIMEIE